MKRIVIVLGLALAACGGGKSDEQSIRDAVSAYTTAVAHDDAAGVCKELTDGWNDNGCAKATSIVLMAMTPDQKTHAIRLGTVHVTGETASAAATGQKDPMRFHKQGGAWRIDR